MERILILSPHSDDAELGCGGSIIKLLERGHEVLWVVFSTAEESLPEGMPKDTLKKEFISVVDKLEFDTIDFNIHNFKVRHMHEHRQEVLDELVSIRKKFQPTLVIGPSLFDLHQDHQIISNEMVRAFKTTSSIISYELPWNHISFKTQLFVRLDKSHVTKKCEMLENYKSQIQKNRRYFSKEFVYGLATTRGTQCDSDYAEAFEVIRWMI